MGQKTPPGTLQLKIKTADPEIRGYIRELESENKKLHMEIAKLEAQKYSAEIKVSAYKKQLKKTLAALEIAESDRETSTSVGTIQHLLIED